MFSCEFSEIFKNTLFYRTTTVAASVLRNFAKLTRKHLSQSLVFNKVAGLRPPTLLKKRLLQRYFPVNFAKFAKTPFLQNISRRLLLRICKIYLLSHQCHVTSAVFFFFVPLQIFFHDKPILKTQTILRR